MFTGKGYSRNNFAQGLIVKKASPPVARTTTESLSQSTATDPRGKGYSRDNFAQGLIKKKPSPPVAPTTITSLRQPTARDPVGKSNAREALVRGLIPEKPSPPVAPTTTKSSRQPTARDPSGERKNSDASTTNFAGSIVCTVNSEHPTTTTTCKSLHAESENPAILPLPPPVVQIQIHHDYENNHDRDDAIDDAQDESSASDFLRRKKLEDLMDERRRFDEKIRAMDQAIQDLRITGEGRGDDTIALGSTESTVMTVQSTPHTSPLTNVEARVSTTNSVKSDEDIATQDVRSIAWAVAAPRRRNGQFSGTALNGKIPHGSGALLFDDDDLYQGPFKYGVMQGSNGLLVAASGATYKGGFRLNLRHGYGEEVFPGGSRYVGNYEKGLPHGFGERRNPDGTLFFVGQWVQGKPAGLENVMEHDIDDVGESDSNTAVNSHSSRDILTIPIVLPGSAVQDAMATKMCESNEQHECLICLEAFSRGNPRMPTQCGCGTNKTYFHLPCLYQWKEQSQECPLCRQLITWEEF